MTDRPASPLSRIPAPVEDLRDRLLTGFGKAVDTLEANIGKAPADMQPAARKAVEVARARPLLTMAGLALGALVIAGRARRR